jgi:hypothetical protein
MAAVAASLLTGAVVAATGIAGSGSSTSGPPPTLAQAFKDRQTERDQHLANIAKRLSVSADDLSKAIDKARRAQLDQAVADNKLTAAQRDAILACQADPLKCDRSNLPAFGPRRGGQRPRRPTAAQRRAHRNGENTERTAFFAAVAKELNKDAADVRKAFEAERPARGPGGPGGPDGPRGHHGPGGPDGPPGGPEGAGFGGPGGPGF